MMQRSFLLLWLVFSCTGILPAQAKFEKESRIRSNQVPERAIAFMQSIQLPVKVKWFREEGLDGTSFEAKFIHQRVKYSIEFDTTGLVQDVEMETKWESLKDVFKEVVSQILAADCQNYKIVKVQEQFSGKEEYLKALWEERSERENLIIRFELILRCKKDQTTNLYEYLFDENGQIISVLKIIQKNSSHLEY